MGLLVRERTPSVHGAHEGGVGTHVWCRTPVGLGTGLERPQPSRLCGHFSDLPSQVDGKTCCLIFSYAEEIRISVTGLQELLR